MPDKLLVRAVSSMAALAFILLIAGRAQNPARQSQRPQKQDETVARIETELVQIDVVVTDKKGQPVRDLKREDFQLFEDGKPQTITHFAVSTAARPADWLAADAKRAIKEGPGKELPGKESPGKEAPIKEPAVSNNPAATQTGRYLVLAVDDLSLIPPHLLDVKRTLRRFIDEQMVGGDQAAIITTSGNLGLLQQFTTDRYLLRHTIDRLQIRNPSAARPAFPHISDYQAELIEANDREALSIAVEELLSSRQAMLDSEEFINHLIEKNDPIVQQARSLARRIVTENTQRTTITLSSLEKYLRLLGPLPGRKALLLLSDGFLLGGPRNNKLPDLLRIADAALRAGVVIYSLDVRGLAAGVPGRDATVEARFNQTLFPGAEARIAMQGFNATRDGLNALAKDTGGFTIFDHNDLSDGLRRVLDDNEAYYLLAFEPPSSYRDGRFRKLEVRVPGRPDLKVRTRKGYYAPDDKALAKNAAKLTAAKLNAAKAKGKPLDPAKAAQDAEIQSGLDSLFPLRGIPVALAADFVNAPTVGAAAVLSAQIDAARLSFTQADGLRRAAFELAGVVFDEKGKIAASFSDHVDLNLKPESFEQAMKNGLSYRRLVTLQPGLYQLRLAVREEATAQIGSAFQWVEIGDLSKKQPRLSSLIFTSEKDDLSSLLRSEAQREGVVSYDQPRLAQTSRRFKRGGQADFLVFVYNAGTSGQDAGDVFIRKELSAGGRLINTSKPVAIGSSVEQFGEVIPYTERLLLDALAAGDYELRITLSDRAGKVMDSRGIGFTVE